MADALRNTNNNLLISNTNNSRIKIVLLFNKVKVCLEPVISHVSKEVLVTL